MRSNRAAIVVLVLLVAGGMWGAYALLRMRLAGGDVYPAYSSLRADPLGTRALHDALAEVPGTTVRRNHEPLFRLGEMTSATMFVLGAETDDLLIMDIGSFDAIQSVVLSGGRLVVSFAPVSDDPKLSWVSQRKQADEKRSSEKASARRRARGDGGDRGTTATDRATSAIDRNTTGGRESDLPTTVSVRERWGVEPEFVALGRDGGKYRTETAYPTIESGLVFEVPWHTALVFKSDNPAWRTILKRAGKPVLVERAIGRGSVVLCADSYFLSNEALRDSRNAELLAWLLGGNRTVVFEETVHGIGVQPGVMGFVRHFRLHGLVAGVLAVMALFVWRNATSLVPPFEDADATGANAVAGRDMAAGFVNLLRRNIPPKELIRVCVGEWQKSAGAGADAAALEKVRRIVEADERLPARQRDPLGVYRRISEMLEKRRGK